METVRFRGQQAYVFVVSCFTGTLIKITNIAVEYHKKQVDELERIYNRVVGE